MHRRAILIVGFADRPEGFLANHISAASAKSGLAGSPFHVIRCSRGIFIDFSQEMLGGFARADRLFVFLECSPGGLTLQVLDVVIPEVCDLGFGAGFEGAFGLFFHGFIFY